MDENIKKLWIDALRSGEYLQGQGQLKEEGEEPRYCCLGVLCDLYQKQTGNTIERVLNGVAWFDEKFDLTPAVVTEWAGLSNRDPNVDVPGSDGSFTECVSQLNDNGYTFEQIATAIENSL